ncbi:MAG: HAD-IA family hydrolase [Desulfocapsaceae bacterium]|jgi:putative hydrolase of the HAD superfamily|nr:HAD-IA family hydrolase [Desulfocapsaceae bacterium]
MQEQQRNSRIRPDFEWDNLDTVLLDMDGTLLDKYFDDYFWEHYVPLHYAEKNNLSFDSARRKLLKRYRLVESTLQWTDLDYWTGQLGLDIPGLKVRINHLINIHPFVPEFLDFVKRRRKRVILVTAAHRKTLQIKIEKTGIAPLFDQIICAEEVGTAKEDTRFWHLLEDMLDFNKDRTLLADDTARVLESAQRFGIKELIHIAKPSSRKPAQYSPQFPSITRFDELIF